MKQFLKKLFCGHEFSPNLFADRGKGKSRHFYVCKKCGKRIYVD